MQRNLLCAWVPFHFLHAFIFTINLGILCPGFSCKVHSLVLMRFLDCYTTSAFCLSARAKRTLAKSRCYRIHGGAYRGKACWTAEKTKGNPVGLHRGTQKEHTLKRSWIRRAAPTAYARGKHEITQRVPLEDARGKAGRSRAEREGAL